MRPVRRGDVLVAGVIADTVSTLVGTIGTHIRPTSCPTGDYAPDHA
ncbi:hypothetical protein [Lentzea sp. E54]